MSEDTTPRELLGVITEDPLKGLPVGAKITFSSDLFTPNAPAGLADVSNWDFFDGAVIGLLFGASSGFRRLAGSGVMVAPGVALTARHCVTLEEMKEDSEMNAVMEGRAAFICVAISSAGAVTWRPRQVTLVGNTDLAILTVEGASALPEVLHNATISTRLPKVGERIVIAGHPRHEYEAEGGKEQFGLRMVVAAGTVTARYEQGRDWLRPWPTLAIDCPALGGMSGGPAFDERGFLIGLLSSSSDGEPVAYVSLLWPSLTAKVTPPWPPGLYQAPMSLLEMDRRLCGVERPDALEIVRDGSDGNDKVIYRPWDE